jgi:hypothetical protein
MVPIVGLSRRKRRLASSVGRDKSLARLGARYITEQDTMRITRAQSPEDCVSIGRHVESRVLCN